MHVKLPFLTKKICPLCHGTFETRRSDSTYCSNSCRSLAWQDRKKGIETIAAIPVEELKEEDKTQLKLEFEAKKLEKLLLDEPKHEKRKTIDSSSVLNSSIEEKKPIAEYKKTIEKKCSHCKKHIYINLAIHFVKARIDIVGVTWEKPFTAYFCNTNCEAEHLKEHSNYRSKHLKK
jgi:hypothetical protein